MTTDTKAAGLLRKARTLRHRAARARAQGRTWDAAQLANDAAQLEARAEHRRSETPHAVLTHALEDRAGFADEDIPTISTVREAEDFYGLVLR